MRRLADWQSGFTLVEVMTVLVVSGLLLGGMWQFYHSALYAYRRGLQEVRLTQNARTVLCLMTRDIQIAKNPALITNLLLPGRTSQALVYILETDDPHDILELVSPFAGLVQWDIAPAIEINEILPPAESTEDDDPPPYLPP
jgi:prepilin-type N-terminal cleavage/methylation domain-containing protein